MRVKLEPQVSLPEVIVPSIVVSSNHYDRHSAAQPGQRGGDVKTTSRDYAGIGEPEIEQIAVDQQAIAQDGNGLEEFEQRLLDARRRHAKVGIGNDNEGVAQHGAKDGPPLRPPQPERHEASMAPGSPISETQVRVNYSETDQMGVVYHARYLVWLDIARTEHLRRSGMSYRDLERAGLRLAVSDVSIKYRQPARYDDPIRIRCWVRELASRRVTFGYVVEHGDDGRVLATATTSLLTLDPDMQLARLPDQVRAALLVTPDPIKL